jgi:predicted oxidoreductase
MNKEATAVEWLENQIVAHKRMFGVLPTVKGFMNLIEEAKKIENTQRKEMYLRGIKNYDPTYNDKTIESYE